MARKSIYPPIGVGHVFSRWTVIAPANIRQGRRYFLCKCTCGMQKDVLATGLARGTSKGCGMCDRKGRKWTSPPHGEAVSSEITPEYIAWTRMHARCLNPRSQHYHRYGGRGITVCDRWGEYANFLADMGRRPSPKHSLDRRENDGNYEPANCRWATKRQQVDNRSTTRVVQFEGSDWLIPDLSKRFGIPAGRLRMRIDRGWPILDALTRPVGYRMK